LLIQFFSQISTITESIPNCAACWIESSLHHCRAKRAGLTSDERIDDLLFAGLGRHFLAWQGLHIFIFTLLAWLPLYSMIGHHEYFPIRATT
jgi:hypothetical protein